MATENNWLTCNLNKRFDDFNSDFKVIMKPTKFKYLSFEEAATDAAFKIANKNDNIYISLSGGLDSEFILVLLHNLKIKAKPIIVKFPANELESSYAFYMCKKLNIEPIVIEITNDQYIQIFKKEIADTINGYGWNVVPIIIASKYVSSRKGCLITGEHLIDDDPLITKASMCEWDFYQDILFPNNESYGLLAYTPEINYAIIKAFDGSPVQEFKSKLYDLNFRPKIHNQYSEKETKQFEESRKFYPRPKYMQIFGDKQKMISMMESWN